MSKLLPHEDHPLELCCYAFADHICPFFHSLGFTPNGLTTIANIGAIIALVSAYRKNANVWLVVGVVIKYLFDCADGHFARKYKMTSKWGDTYDHVSDLIFVIGMIIVIVTRYGFVDWAYPYRGYFIALMLFFVFMTYVHAGCQETLNAKRKEGADPSDTLAFCKGACPGNPEETIQYTRWFGCPVVPTVFATFSLVYLLK